VFKRDILNVGYLYSLPFEMSAAVSVLVRLRGETHTYTASSEERYFLSHEGNVITVSCFFKCGSLSLCKREFRKFTLVSLIAVVPVLQEF
jgi:hypothetical protein